MKITMVVLASTNVSKYDQYFDQSFSPLNINRPEKKISINNFILTRSHNVRYDNSHLIIILASQKKNSTGNSNISPTKNILKLHPYYS